MVHSLKYAFKTILKNKGLLIWTAIFPIALATFMNMAFGNIYEKDMVFKTIKIDIVKNQELIGFDDMIANLEADENPMIDAKYTNEEEAKKDLENGDITAIVYEDTTIKTVVTANDYNQQILKNIFDSYLKKVTLIVDVSLAGGDYSFQGMENAANGEAAYLTEKSTSEGSQDPYVNYFYAIFAMSCLFASFGTIEIVTKLQANLSPLGMRRCVAATSKSVMVTAEFFVMWIVTFVIEMFAYAYMRIIGINLSTNIPAVMGILIFGTGFGIALGVIIGCIPKLSLGAKTGIAVAVSMALSVMADLCAGGVKDLIEHSCPIINRISPAALITDAFYSLCVFDDFSRYSRNLVTLGGMTAALLVVSFILLRRTKNASL